jgi:uncharacterized protein YcsI (UPF0317 family)
MTTSRAHAAPIILKWSLLSAAAAVSLAAGAAFGLAVSARSPAVFVFWGCLVGVAAGLASSWSP